MVEEGAAIVDVGGESTRPGASPVSLDDELRRVVPVLEALKGDVPVSIDTAKAEVARSGVALGAELVNDVTALRGDPELAGVVAESGAYLCLMHMLGEPRTMQVGPRYDDVVSEVAAFLEERLRFAVDAGIHEDRICLDPGFGFGKTVEHNFELLRRLERSSRSGGRCSSASRASARSGVSSATPRRPPACSASLAAAVMPTTEEQRSARPRRARDRRGADRRRDRLMIVELEGLEIFGHHGVLEEERRDGRNFFYDISLEVSEPPSPTGSKTRSTTVRSRPACRRSRTESSSSSSRRSPEPSPTRSSSGSRSNTSASASASRIRGPRASRSRTRPLSPSARGLDRRGRDRELVADRSDPAHGRRRPQVSLDVVVRAALGRVPDADALPARTRLFRERLQVRLRRPPLSNTFVVRGPQSARSTSAVGEIVIAVTRRPATQTR